MTKQEMLTKFQGLFQSGQTPDMSSVLSLMSEIGADYDDRDQQTLNAQNATTKLEAATAETNKLKETNYNLFMSLGTPGSTQFQRPGNPTPAQQQSFNIQAALSGQASIPSPENGKLPTQSLIYPGMPIEAPGTKEVSDLIGMFRGNIEPETKNPPEYGENDQDFTYQDYTTPITEEV